MTILVANALLYLLWFIYIYKKEKTVSLYSSLILLILFIAISAVYSVATGIYFKTFGNFNLDIIEITPFLLTLLGFIIAFHPLRNIELSDDGFPEFYTSIFSLFVKFWVVLSTAYTVLKIGEASVAISIGLDQVYEARHISGDTLSYMTYTNPILSKIAWIGYIVSSSTCPIMLLYSMVNLSQNNNKFLSFYILFLAIASAIANGIAMGSRGAMVWSVFRLLFIVFLMKDSLSSNYKKMIFGVLGSGLGVVVLYSVMITISRVGDTGALDSIIRYFGEPFPNMSFLYWDEVTNHPMGDRFFPDFVGFNDFVGYSPAEVHNYWGNVTGVPILNWKILYCDCYIEFGKIGGLLFLAILSFIFTKLIHYKSINVYNISILFFYFEMCDSSFTGYNAFSNNIISTAITIAVVDWLMYVFCKRINKIAI